MSKPLTGKFKAGDRVIDITPRYIDAAYTEDEIELLSLYLERIYSGELIIREDFNT